MFKKTNFLKVIKIEMKQSVQEAQDILWVSKVILNSMDKINLSQALISTIQSLNTQKTEVVVLWGSSQMELQQILVIVPAKTMLTITQWWMALLKKLSNQEVVPCHRNNNNTDLEASKAEEVQLSKWMPEGSNRLISIDKMLPVVLLEEHMVKVFMTSMIFEVRTVRCLRKVKDIKRRSPRGKESLNRMILRAWQRSYNHRLEMIPDRLTLKGEQESQLQQ